MSDQETWRREVEGARLVGQRWVPARGQWQPPLWLQLAAAAALIGGLIAALLFFLP